jgi:nuclear pore complex protein Nup155
VQCAHFNSDFVTELNDKLEVALIQQKIYDQLPDTPARRELDDTLFDISKLYNSYAKPYGLLESQLEILRASKYENPSLVRAIWDAIIAREITQSTLTTQPDISPPLPRQTLNQLVAAVKKVATTAFTINRADNVFPLFYLLDKLEKLALEAGDTRATVMSAMHSTAGVPYQMLWEVYKEMSHKQHWQSPQAKTHILSVRTTMLEEWANSSKTDYSDQQQFNALKVDSAIDELLSDLNTIPTSDAGACEARLRTLRRTCDRLPPIPRLMW